MIPLFGITPGDMGRVEGLREEYNALARSPNVLESLESEMGAYFVTAIR